MMDCHLHASVPASGSNGVMDSVLVNEQWFRHYAFFRQHLRPPKLSHARSASSSLHRHRPSHLFVTSLGEHYVVRYRADVMESRVTSSVNKQQPTIIRRARALYADSDWRHAQLYRICDRCLLCPSV